MKYYTPKQAADILSVSVASLRRWETEGKIKSIKTVEVSKQIPGVNL